VSEQDPAYARYVLINLPHCRTIVQRIGRSLEALGALGDSGNGAASELRLAFRALEDATEAFDEDPPFEAAVRAADAVAERARALVAVILAGTARGDRLGQHVRNLFECLGLAAEGARLSVECGESPDSPLR